MDAKNNCEVLNEIFQKIRLCYSKMEDDVFLIKNEWRMMSPYFDGQQAELFKAKTKDACDAVCSVMAALQQMELFIQSLDTSIRDYNRTEF